MVLSYLKAGEPGVLVLERNSYTISVHFQLKEIRYNASLAYICPGPSATVFPFAGLIWYLHRHPA